MISCDRQSFYVETPGPRNLSPSRLGGNISGRSKGRRGRDWFKVRRFIARGVFKTLGEEQTN